MMLLGPTIPGETLIDDVSGLLIKGITTRAELNEHEAANIAKAVEKYLLVRPSARSAKFDYSWCLKLHAEMFGDVWEWAGTVRTRDGYNIGIKCHAIPENLELLIQDLREFSTYGIELVEQAARLHHRAVQIHPFQNGNGRWARMLANIWLKQNRHGIIKRPEVVIGTESEIRNRYLAAMKLADDYDFSELIALQNEFAEKKVSATTSQ
jgi:Fic-DOC domain mobile mystery protein B